MDLFRALASVLRSELLGKGYLIPAGWGDTQVVEGYVNLLLRQLHPEPRQFHKAIALSCPPDATAGLEELVRKIELGEPLRPHQSRTLKKPGYNDGLFTDWGVQHFHLGTVVQSDGFVERTGPVLFALCRDRDFYAIQIYEHGAWAKAEVVELLQANWPEVTAPFELKGVKPITPELSEEDIAAFRKAGLMHLVQVDGKFVYPMGGGVVSTGDSAAVVQDVSTLRTLCRELEDLVRKELEEVNLAHVNEADLVLTRRGKFIVVRDQSAGERLDAMRVVFQNRPSMRQARHQPRHLVNPEKRRYGKLRGIQTAKRAD